MLSVTHPDEFEELVVRITRGPLEPSATGQVPATYVGTEEIDGGIWHRWMIAGHAWMHHVLAGLPPISDEAKATHHEAIVIRKLARALYLWLELAREHQAVIDEAMCCEFVRLMRDLERAAANPLR